MAGLYFFFFFKQKTAYEMRISDWSSDVCSSDLPQGAAVHAAERLRKDAATMARVKRGVTSHARHKKVLALAKGYRGRSSTNYRIAIEKVEKALRYAYRDRRNRKRDFRGLWIKRINAGVREHGLTYSRFMPGVK